MVAKNGRVGISGAHPEASCRERTGRDHGPGLLKIDSRRWQRESRVRPAGGQILSLNGHDTPVPRPLSLVHSTGRSEADHAAELTNHPWTARADFSHKSDAYG